jgi:leucyl aminopeptidase
VVGKGITFDSGGLSLKSPKDMEEMKYDMSGAGVVLGLFSILEKLAPRVEVHGVVAATENLPSGHATRPGDVLRSYRGKTIEVLNTDAEGRLTLADALAYTEEQGVDEMIDLATLTGACMVGLGAATGVFGRPQAFVDRVLAASARSGDRSWQLPLFDDYRDAIRSRVADVKNTGGRWGGAITAALFLEEFVSDEVAWIHMDIAGSAWAEKETPYLQEGATGAGLRTLVTYLETLSEGNA